MPFYDGLSSLSTPSSSHGLSAEGTGASGQPVPRVPLYPTPDENNHIREEEEFSSMFDMYVKDVDEEEPSTAKENPVSESASDQFIDWHHQSLSPHSLPSLEDGDSSWSPDTSSPASPYHSPPARLSEGPFEEEKAADIPKTYAASYESEEEAPLYDTVAAQHHRNRQLLHAAHEKLPSTSPPLWLHPSTLQPNHASSSSKKMGERGSSSFNIDLGDKENWGIAVGGASEATRGDVHLAHASDRLSRDEGIDTVRGLKRTYDEAMPGESKGTMTVNPQALKIVQAKPHEWKGKKRARMADPEPAPVPEATDPAPAVEAPIPTAPPPVKHCGLKERGKVCAYVLIGNDADWKHISTHKTSSNGRFKCTFGNCAQDFAQNDKLKEHIMSQHWKEEWPCDICGSVFVRKTSRAHHVKTHHR
ncbi:hypothetical protein C8Q79DRAFT_1049079 [Trametes meyenii]|nr:hypothetical protein C8Q79DRAFT_1049079 [Trametes meyenii]